MKKIVGTFLIFGLLISSAWAEEKVWKELFDQGVKALEAKQDEAAEQFFGLALAEARKDGKYSLQLSSTYMNLGHIFSRRGSYELAERMHHNALAINQKILGENNPETAVDMANLADAAFHLAKYEEAEKINLAALNVLKQAGQSSSPVSQGILSNLKLVYEKQGKPDMVKQVETLLAAIEKHNPKSTT